MRIIKQKEKEVFCVALGSQNMNEFSPASGSVRKVATGDFNAILKTQTDLTKFSFPPGICSK